MTAEPGRELQALRELRALAGHLAAEPDPRKLVPLVLEQAIALVGARRGFVILLSRDGARFDVAAARNLERAELERPDLEFSRSVARRVAETGKAELVHNALTEPATRDVASIRALDLRSILCVPLRALGRTLGVINVDHPFAEGEFDAQDLATLEAFAVPAAIALDAARRQAELEEKLATIGQLRAELAERYRERSREADRLREEAASRLPGAGEELPGIVARSPAMRRVVQLVKKVAPSDVPVLVVGESGTGKELVARAVHALSGRRRGPLVAENCAALAEPLLESELFGYEPGAFTGATKSTAGLLESASGGTLFLDEVGEMSASLQAKLLRVLQEKEVRRLGGHRPIPIDVRVVAATHRDLDAMVAEGTFRQDLLYRLNVVRLEIPPLRDRPEDVACLLEHFIERARGEKRVTLDPQLREILLSHAWPGNVRELENEVRRLVVMAGDDGLLRPGLASQGLLAPKLGPAPVDTSPTTEGVWRLDELEKEMVKRALKAARGNKTAAARLLGIPKTSLYNRIAKYGLAASGPD